MNSDSNYFSKHEMNIIICMSGMNIHEPLPKLLWNFEPVKSFTQKFNCNVASSIFEAPNVFVMQPERKTLKIFDSQDINLSSIHQNLIQEACFSKLSEGKNALLGIKNCSARTTTTYLLLTYLVNWFSINLSSKVLAVHDDNIQK